MSTAPIPVSPEGVPGAVLDPSRIAAEDLTYPGAGGTAINAYLAYPAAHAGARPSAHAPGSLPGMIVIHEAGGLGEHIRDVTRRFANIGYLALGVDLYTREGGPPPTGDLPAIMERLFAMPDERVLGDLEGAADLLRARPEHSGRTGCIGFCMGGRFALLFACCSARLDATVDCWGGFIDRSTPEEISTPTRPTPPIELVANLACPLMAAIGAEDHNPSPQIGEELRERLAATPHETYVDVYDGASHAFFADYRPSYRPEPAAVLWGRVVPFLARHLQGSPRAAAAEPAQTADADSSVRRT
ncbi:MAG TPA: dienelactone hydrolase family protein [Solirubrobacteraceae bacterium]|jgi:carboxymethylenebutenolidase